MKHLLILFTLTYLLTSCRKNELNPAKPATNLPSGRSVLIYSSRFPGLQDTPGTFEVTNYDQNGLPVQARTSTYYSMYVASGTYTSTIKLTYDDQLRIKKTVQTHDQFAYASCCPGSVTFNPKRQLVSEYEYQGNTQNVAHELAYWLDEEKAEKKVLGETFRSFTPNGQLMQEKIDGRVRYEAIYDNNEQVVSETLFRDNTPAVVRQWENTYDGNQRLASRKIKGTDIFENNTYDSQGRLLRRVTNLYSLTPFPAPSIGKLIDYGFTKSTARWEMDFMFFGGQFLSGTPAVQTYEYVGGETRVTQLLYNTDVKIAGAAEPGFDFTQIPQEKLRSVQQTKWRFNHWKKMTHEEVEYLYQSDKLAPEQRAFYELQATIYDYDNAGNVVSQSGYTISDGDKKRGELLRSTARYKTF